MNKLTAEGCSMTDLDIALPGSIIAEQLEAVRESLELNPHQNAVISCAIDRINLLTARTLELSRSLIKQQDQGGWIKCSDRMPENGQHVLATNRRFHLYETAIFCVSSVSGVGYFGTSSGKFIATHWQSLPPPPDDV